MQNQIILFLVNNQKSFRQSQLETMKSTLLQMSPLEVTYVLGQDYKDPSSVVFMSVMFGFLGIDRLMIEDNLLGVLKLLTLGGCFVWYIIDLFFIGDATRDYNYNLFMKYANNTSIQGI